MTANFRRSRRGPDRGREGEPLARLSDFTESENRYRILSELSPDAIVTAKGGRFIDCNQATADLLHMNSKEEFIGLKFFDISPPTQPDGTPSRKSIRPFLRQCLTAGKASFEWTFRRMSGEEFPCEVLMRPFELAGTRVVQGIARDISRRKHAEKVSRDNEQYLKSVMEASPVAVTVVDQKTGLVRYANRAAIALMNFKESDEVRWEETLFWANLLERETLMHMIQKDGHASKAVRMNHPDGREIHVLVTCQPNPANPDHLIWWTVDISEQKAVEGQLWQQQRLLKLILDHVPVAVFAKDVNDDFRYILNNRKSVEMFDAWHRQVVGKTDFDSSEFDVANKVRQQDLELVRTGQAVDNPEQVFQNSTGEIRHLHTRKVLVRDSAGIPSLILGVSEDISEQKEAELALRISEKRFRELAASAPVGIFLTDPRGACIYVNEHWRLMSGLSEEEAAGNRWVRALHEDDRLAVAEAWQKFTRGESDFIREYRFVTADGKVTWVSGRAVAFRNENGQVVGYLGSTTDITSIKRFESELKSSRDEAQRANAAKSDFLSRMSHELRTPLNAVLGFAQLLQMDNANLTPYQNKGINHILGGGEHLLNLIEDVLDFSRIDSGHTNLRLHTFSLDQLLQSAIPMVGSLAEKHHVTVHSLAAAPAQVIGDPHRSRQILVNLLSNAIKYNKPGGAVTVSASTLPNCFTRISIKDTGRGIRPGDRERVFEPFERISDPDSMIEGTGIGLSICRKLAELMGGQVGFESEIGIGSTFWLDIPTSSASEPIESFEGNEKLSALTKMLLGVQILYVEDDVASISLMTEIVRIIPECKFVVAYNGREGVALAKSSLPDVVLMDINLPGLGGFEALKLIRDDPRTCDIPVIALSASASRELIARAGDAGFSRFLTKPLRLDTLLHAIANAYKPAA